MKQYINTPDEITEDKILRRAFSGEVIKGIDKEKRHIEFVISTASVDRYGDIIDVNGWDLKAYRKNPVVLFGHESSMPPIGRALKVWKDEGALRAIAEFMPEDMSAFAYSIFRMFEEKFLNAVSVGFKPLKWDRILDEDGNETWAFHFKKQELLEFSAVPIPANPEALISARQKGIDTAPVKQWVEEMLDNWNKQGNQLSSLYGIERKEMELLRRRAAGAGATFQVPPDLQDEIMKRNLEAVRKAKAEKEKAKNHVDITLKDQEYILPSVNKDSYDNLGVIEILTETKDDGEVTRKIIKADDLVLLSPEILEQSDFFEIKEIAEDGGPVFRFVACNYEFLEYEAIGVTQDDQIVALKTASSEISDEVTEKIEESKLEPLEIKVEEFLKTEEGEKAIQAFLEKSKKPKKPKAEDEEPEDEDEDEDDEKDFVKFGGSLFQILVYVESMLTCFEDHLDKSVNKVHNKQEQRKLEFLANYMRELSDRLDDGKGKEKAITVTSSEKTESKEKQEGTLTPIEAADYIKSLTEKLQPVLSELITKKINNIKGRLD